MHDVTVGPLRSAFGVVVWIAVCEHCYWMGDRLADELDAVQQGLEHIESKGAVAVWESGWLPWTG